MTLLTEQQSKINRNLEKVRNDWIVDSVCKQIKRKPGFLRKAISWFLWKRYSVKEIYIFLKHEWAEKSQLQCFSFPMDHDNFPKPKSIPFIYRLDHGWEIPPEDLKILVNGPLISQSGDKILVEATVRWRQVYFYLKYATKIIIQLSLLFSALKGIYEISKAF
jgi:hypothetical protein